MNSTTKIITYISKVFSVLEQNKKLQSNAAYI